MSTVVIREIIYFQKGIVPGPLGVTRVIRIGNPCPTTGQSRMSPFDAGIDVGHKDSRAGDA
jgi:hypothetical protein